MVKGHDAQRRRGDALDPEQALDQFGVEQKTAAEDDVGFALPPRRVEAKHAGPAMLAGDLGGEPAKCGLILDLDFDLETAAPGQPFERLERTDGDSRRLLARPSVELDAQQRAAARLGRVRDLLGNRVVEHGRFELARRI